MPTLLTETNGKVKWRVIKENASTGGTDYEVGLNLREPTTQYHVGDIVFDHKIPSYMRLRCVTAGTSSANEELSIPS
jgi:hypothetical protein